MHATDIVWSSPPPRLNPAVGELLLWRISLESPPFAEEQALNILSATEQERVATARMPLRRQQLLWSRFLLRTIATAITGTGPRDVIIHWPENGPPRIEAGQSQAGNLSISLAHSGTMILAGLVVSARLGIDIERCDQGRRTKLLAARFFHPSDIALLNELAPDERQRLFFTLWTCKEALTKACGGSLPEVLRRSCFSQIPGTPPDTMLLLDLDNDTVTSWFACPLAIQEDYQAAAVCSHEIKNIRGFSR